MQRSQVFGICIGADSRFDSDARGACRCPDTIESPLRRGTSCPRRILSTVFAVVLACAMVAPCSWANVAGTDEIDGVSVTERGLTVGESPDVDAAYGELMTSDGTVLWTRRAGESSSIASTTKIMTAVVALENAKLTDTITISKEAAETEESSAGVVEGAKVKLGDLLYGLLLMSGNDAAVAIADGVSGSQEAFVELMNNKAAEIGMTNTHFENPSGLEQGDHHSCAADMALLAQYAMRKDEFRTIVGTESKAINVGAGDIVAESTDQLLNSYEGIEGIKTGWTDEAGYCFIAAAKRDDVELYAVILGSSDEQSRFTSAAALLDWGFSNYYRIELANTKTVVANVPATAWMDKTIPATCMEAVTGTLFTYDGEIDQSISVIESGNDVHEGDVIGSISWSQGGKIVGSTELVASEDCPAPNILQKVIIFIQRLFTDNDTARLETLVNPPTIKNPSAS